MERMFLDWPKSGGTDGSGEQTTSFEARLAAPVRTILLPDVPDADAIERAIRDRQGRPYQYYLSTDNWYQWKVYDGEVPVGEAMCTVQDCVFNIGDIRFRPDVPLPRTWWQKLTGLPIERANYQRREPGSALLPLILEQAKQCRCERITGTISSEGWKEFPGLVDWYRRYGFVFVPGAPDSSVAGVVVLALG